MPEILRLDIKVDIGDIEKESIKIVSLLRKEWNAELIKYKALSGGAVNRNGLCYINESADDNVVVKVYCETSSFMWDRPRALTGLKVLNEQQISCPVLATFKNGICFGCVKGTVYGWGDQEYLNNTKLSRSVMRELAAIHSKKISDMAKRYGLPDDRLPGKFKMISDYLDHFPKDIKDPRFKEIFSKEVYENEFSKLQDMVKKLNLSLTLTHGDVNPTNIIYNSATDRAVIVDYDNVEHDYQFMDIASFFGTAGLGLGTDFQQYPTKEWQFTMFREYLTCLKASGDFHGDEISDADLENLYKIVLKFVLVYYYFFLLILIHFSGTPPKQSSDTYDFLGMALDRQKFYWKLRDELA